MSFIRIRKSFYFVTALAVMFLIACGETVVEDSADESISSVSPSSVKEAPSTSEPTSTPEPTPEPISLSGEGKTATQFIELQKGLWVVDLNHGGNSNFVITVLDSNGDYVKLLVNEIGSFDGSAALTVENTDKYLLDVEADGSWTIDFKSP